MSDLPTRLRAMVGMQVGDGPAMVHEAADEIERLRNLVRAGALTCEQCGAPATFADEDDWCFCSQACMKKMELFCNGEP